MDIDNYTGIELMSMIADGKIPPPPIAKVIPLTLKSVEKGRAVFIGIAGENLANPLGTTHGGFIATLIDSATGCAAHTMLGKGEIYGTIDLNVKMVRPVPFHKELYGEGEVVSMTKSIIISNCTVKDKDGKIYGYGSATCMIIRSNHEPRK